MVDLSKLDGSLDIAYRSDERPMLTAFYEPCLQESVLYRRAVGYFTSGGLAQVARGVARLIDNGGRIELVCSPRLEEGDVESIRNGYRARSEVFREAASRTFESVEDRLIRGQLEGLAWLISEGRLDVKLAVRVDPSGTPLHGFYHEKLGIFSDRDPPGNGNRVAFTGSANETRGGLIDNFESVDVYWSWDYPQGRVQRKEDQFTRLWAGKTAGLDIVDFTDATADILRPYKSKKPPQAIQPGAPSKWRHQDEAVAAFLKAERGVLNMATGTGKTRTALQICDALLNQGSVDTVIVTADGTDLLDQWHGQLLGLASGRDPSLKLLRHYGGHHQRDFFALSRSAVLLISRPQLAPALRRLTAVEAGRTILIHDEVHRLGSPGNRLDLDGLSDAVRFRLGLSATPDREYDADGNAFIEDHIGPVLFEFGLDDAIRRGILAPFEYYPLIYTPDQRDRDRLKGVYARAAARNKAGDPMSQEELWRELARVHKTSEAKLPVFEAFLTDNPHLLERSVVFVETVEYGDAVLDIIHAHRHDFHTYFGGEDPEILNRFARGEIECLLTCHRLSEGIDVQSLRTVVLFSSDRARLETIQRIGRCLRADPGDPSKVAHVVDFVRTPDQAGSGPSADDVRRAFLQALSQIRPDPPDA
ncbi:MAG TPA: DEAD/DEAH box helicase family protein [Rubricoccaceae bacterium]|jgi:superfamily II DNA or RNA helicase